MGTSLHLQLLEREKMLILALNANIYISFFHGLHNRLGQLSNVGNIHFNEKVEEVGGIYHACGTERDVVPRAL